MIISFMLCTSCNEDNSMSPQNPGVIGCNSGLYMGVIGFDNAITNKEISILTPNTKGTFTDFVTSLTSKDGTLLYYAVDNAIDALATSMLPNDLVNVAMVTFTDGLDQGSFMMGGSYESKEEYLSAINKKIKNTKVQGLSISAYSIGLKGDDVTDNAQFKANLNNLASSSDNATEVNSMDEVNAKFQEIANQLYKENNIQNISIIMPGQANGTQIRFTFDNVSDASQSQLYIEGTFSLSDRSLKNITYGGITSGSGSAVAGVQDGIFVTFTFNDLKAKDANYESIPTNNIKQWDYIKSTGQWQQNSEFNPENQPQTKVERKSAVIMLVLDCSSSLGTQFSTMKAHANAFILKMAENTAESTGGGVNTTITDPISGLSCDELVYVEGGTFTMGATSEQGSDYDSHERPTHSVTLSSYYIGKYEVTQQLWEYVMSYRGKAADGSNMSAYTGVWLGANPSSTYGEGSYYPAYNVSWDDIVNKFLIRLNKITGKKYRLPTEAEWEYAARGGKKSKGYKYSGSNTIGDVAWYTSNSGGKTHPVGQKQPNELGIYDMSGNVWEWCYDWYSSYSSSPQTNPTGPTSGSYRMCRGGGCTDFVDPCRVSYRYYYHPNNRGNRIGFRLALDL